MTEGRGDPPSSLPLFPLKAAPPAFTPPPSLPLPLVFLSICIIPFLFFLNLNHVCWFSSCRWVCLPFSHCYRLSISIVFFKTDLKSHPRSGTGYIGSFTTLALLEAGYKVVVADNLYNSSSEALNRIEAISGKKAEFVQLDVTDEKGFDKVFEAHPDIDSVIHFAALKVSPLSNWTSN